MPDSFKKVPVFCSQGAGNAPAGGTPGTQTSIEETDTVPNTAVNDIDIFVRENIRDIMRFIRDKCEEKGITHDELMNITKVAHTSFYRLWKMGRTSEEQTEEDKKPYKPNADHVCRLCIALGVSLTEFQNPPTDDSIVYLPALKENSHEEVMTNMWAEIAKHQETISRLQSEVERLQEDNRRLSAIAMSREEDIRSNITRINKLTDALIERHDQMHELNRQHNERVDKLLDSLLRHEK